MRILRNGIKTAWIPGVAANDAFQPKARSLACPVLLDRLSGVLRTTGKKAAVLPQQRADRVPVPANQYQKQFHGLTCPIMHIFFSRFRISPVKACLSTGRDGLAARRTIRSQEGKSERRVRNTSRTSRFTRLRSTERRRWRFAMTSPNRAPSVCSPPRGR